MVDRFNGSRGMFRNSMGNHNSCAQGSCNSCNSCDSNGGDCHALYQKLKKIDFSLIDTVLYLDAYPECRKALAYYHKLKKEREAVVEALSTKCNMPITNFNNTSEDTWNWTDTPWPWDPAAN